MEIVEYPNYLIYEDGKVYSKKTKRYLKSGIIKTGYKCVVLCNKDGKRKTYQIHRLLAEHYIPNPENKPCVDHINRDRKDNRIINLRWVTYSENSQNTGIRKDNTSGIKNICYCKISNLYQYKKVIRDVKVQKYFKTLEEAIEYKRVYESS